MSNNDNTDNTTTIDVPLSIKLAEEGIIESFKIYKIKGSLEIIFNHKVDRNTAYVSDLRKKDIDTICKKVDIRCKELGFDNNRRLLLKNNISNNWKLFAGLNNNNTSQQQIQQQKQQNESVSSAYDLYDRTKESENQNISFEDWSTKLLEKRKLLNEKVIEYFPSLQLLLDFELSIKTILNIEDITLPFMGIVFAVPSSLKTAFFKFLRNLWYSYYTDKFTARSFVSHSANVPEEELVNVDMLPQIKDKILLTPEFAALFAGKDDDIREQFGIITRVLDGEGLETNSGVHGKRGYHGKYMFTWLGAAVDIPYSVYKFLSTIGFKIYFLRLPRTEVSEDDLYDQLTSKKNFAEKMEEVEKLMMDYLLWFEICPISIGENRRAKIEWNSDKDDKEIIKIINRLALLLSHLRGHVIVYESNEHPEYLPIDNNKNSSSHSSGFSNRLPIIEHPSRANQQLYNLARGHALSYGRNFITKDDIQLIIKVVLSTSLIERVLILDLLIANKGTLTTSQITQSLRISPNTAKRTMTEFKGLELVTMDKVGGDSSNSEYKITLNPKFNWFLTDEFKQLRERFEPTDYQNELKERKSAVSKNTPVQVEKNKNNFNENENGSETRSDMSGSSDSNPELQQETEENKIKNNDSHRGENTDSKTEGEESDSTTDKLVKVSSKGPPIPMTNEQHDSFFGNNNKKEGDSSN